MREKRSSGGQHQIADAISAYLAGEALEGLEGLAVIQRCWVEVVGAEAAAHLQPVKLRGGILVVAVDHAAWASQLGFLSAEIIRALAERIGPDLVRKLEATVRGGARLE